MKWLISQKVRAVNTSSQTPTETEVSQGKRKHTEEQKLKSEEMNHKRKDPKSKQAKWTWLKLGEEAVCTDWSSWRVWQSNTSVRALMRWCQQAAREKEELRPFADMHDVWGCRAAEPGHGQKADSLFCWASCTSQRFPVHDPHRHL